ncbi:MULTISPECIES: hypothetical protein [unclassified Moraxella]|uniref:hypothetical protein n=1 Tax=unclassified Moraxella TaxID=2685852 RepID=UPI003AF9103E
MTYFVKPISVAMFSLAITTLTGCGQETHAPRKGEFGETMVNAIRLTSDEVKNFNNAPQKATFMDSKVSLNIGFEGENEKNPYRYVAILRGKAVSQGEVEVKLMGGAQNEMSNGFKPEMILEDDTKSYDAGEKVLLLVPSEPFSVANNPQAGKEYLMNALLTEKTNFEAEEIEVQIWQGKGSKRSWLAYLGFLAIVLSALLGVYRLATGLKLK